MTERITKWGKICLCVFFIYTTPFMFFTGSALAEEQKTSSWTDYFSRFFIFWETDSNKKTDNPSDHLNTKRKNPVYVSDFLPNNLPGISEYRQAVTFQRWQSRPHHSEQDVYNLFGVSARKGNVLALLKQYEMYLENRNTTEEGTQFFAERLEETCQQVYPVAVTGNPDAQYLYARHCVNAKNPQAQSWYMRAMKQYRTFAEKNMPYAQYMLGEIYLFYGEEKTAQDWFVHSAMNGNADAVCRIKLNVFSEKELWKNLGYDVKGNHSCAVYQALKLISQKTENKVVSHAATQLFKQIPIGYAQKGFNDHGFSFYPSQRPLDQVSSEQDNELTASQIQKSNALVEKYKDHKMDFVNDYLDKFDWKRLSPF